MKRRSDIFTHIHPFQKTQVVAGLLLAALSRHSLIMRPRPCFPRFLSRVASATLRTYLFLLRRAISARLRKNWSLPFDFRPSLLMICAFVQSSYPLLFIIVDSVLSKPPVNCKQIREKRILGVSWVHPRSLLGASWVLPGCFCLQVPSMITPP